MFGEFSGYKVNSSKSTILFFNKYEEQNPKILTPLSVAQEELGIKIIPEIENIALFNYGPIVQSTSESLSRWMSMPISMPGHINIIKMSILPKFLYLFQSITLPLLLTLFVVLGN